MNSGQRLKECVDKLSKTKESLTNKLKEAIRETTRGREEQKAQ